MVTRGLEIDQLPASGLFDNSTPGWYDDPAIHSIRRMLVNRHKSEAINVQSLVVVDAGMLDAKVRGNRS